MLLFIKNIFQLLKYYTLQYNLFSLNKHGFCVNLVLIIKII